MLTKILGMGRVAINYELELSRARAHIPRAHAASYVYPALTCIAELLARVCEYVDDLYRHNALDLCA